MKIKRLRSRAPSSSASPSRALMSRASMYRAPSCRSSPSRAVSSRASRSISKRFPSRASPCLAASRPVVARRDVSCLAPNESVLEDDSECANVSTVHLSRRSTFADIMLGVVLSVRTPRRMTPNAPISTHGACSLFYLFLFGVALPTYLSI